MLKERSVKPLNIAYANRVASYSCHFCFCFQRLRRRYRKRRLCVRKTIEGMIATRGLERTPFSMRLGLKRSGNLKVMSRRSDDFQCCHENTVKIQVDIEVGDIAIVNTSAGDKFFANFYHDLKRQISLIKYFFLAPEMPPITKRLLLSMFDLWSQKTSHQRPFSRA